MKKIVVISDSHGNYSVLKKLSNIINDSDIVIHLGDGVLDLNHIQIKKDIQTYKIKGNNDYLFSIPEELILDIEGNRLLLTHGNKYRVKSGIDNLLNKAINEKANIVLFGHTHVAKIEKKEGILFINPGTLYNFYDNFSFCYLLINNEKIIPTINNKFY